MRVSSCGSFLALVVLSLSIGQVQAQDAQPCRAIQGAMLFVGNGRGVGPYTATIVTTHDRQFPDGNSIHTAVTNHQWRDSSGRTRVETSSGCFPDSDGQMKSGLHVAVFDPTTGTNYNWEVAPLNRKVAYISARLTRPPQPPPSPEEIQKRKAAMQRQKEEEQRQTESLGIRVIQGIECQGTKTTQTIPAGRIGNALPLTTTDELWTAKGFGSAMLRIHDDPQTGKVRTEVVEIKQGEPDPSLFAPPSDYTVEEMITKTVTPTANQ